MEPILRDFPDTLETARLRIRPPMPGDGPVHFAALRDSLAELRRFPASLPWALTEPSVEASEAYCRRAHAESIARRDLPLLLFRKDDGALVGSSGLHRMDWAVPRFEVGFWGRTTHRGQGYMTEGVAAIVAFAFAHLGARRVDAFPDEANEPSCKVCERAQCPQRAFPYMGAALAVNEHQSRLVPYGFAP